jgi:hypothetical protein
MKTILFLILIFLISIFLYKIFNKKTKEQFNFNNNLIIYNNFYEKNTFNKIKLILEKIELKYDRRVNSRKTRCLLKKDYEELYNLIYNNNKLKNLIKKTYKNNYIDNPDFPIEYREYFDGSSGMRWHQDLSMFSPDCLEAVLTIENNSDSKFMWDENEEIKSIKPLENTLVIVKPNTISHKVSRVNGNRTIIKFILQFKDSIKKESFHYQIKNCPI